MRHQRRFFLREVLWLIGLVQRLRFLPQQPLDAIHSGSVSVDGESGVILLRTPSLPVKVVQQSLGEITRTRGPTSKG